MIEFDAAAVRAVEVRHAPAGLADRFQAIPVAVIGDAMQRLGMCDAGIVPMTPGRSAVGSAVPVLVRSGDNAGIYAALQHVQPGDVLVVNGFADMTRALLGSILAHKLRRAGAAGVVLDGCVRDHRELMELGFPVWARGVSPSGPYKNGPAVVGEPVAVGGIAVCAGDLVAADDDGVVVIPAHRAEEVLAATRDVIDKENALMADLTG